jgi:hypothetical protein
VTKYRVGQKWEDREGDRWKVVHVSPTTLGCTMEFNGHRETSLYIHANYGPLALVEDVPEINIRDGSSSFVTKDSGERQTFSTGMQRDTNTGKPRFDLLFPEDVPFEHQMVTREALLMMRGAEKYDARNWERAGTEEELARFKESALRHCIMWFCGMTDEDHAAATSFNLRAHETTKWKIENS